MPTAFAEGIAIISPTRSCGPTDAGIDGGARSRSQSIFSACFAKDVQKKSQYRPGTGFL
jgi:hypothetical protein